MIIIASALLTVSIWEIVRYLSDVVRLRQNAKRLGEWAPVAVPAMLDNAYDEALAIKVATRAVNMCIRDAFKGLTISTVYAIFTVSYLWGVL